MKTTKQLLAVLVPALLAGSAQAATVVWNPVQTITGASDIQTGGLVVNVSGANFGITTGTTTTVNNGVDNIDFKSLRSGQNATLTNGINVAAEATWINFGNAGGNSNIAGTFGIVLDSNLGIEVGDPADADITLSNLNIGTKYQIQLFVSDLRAAANILTQTVSSGNVSGSMTADNGTNGTYVTGTFTADATSQVLTVTGTGGDQVALANALTIGEVVPEPTSLALLGLGGLMVARRRRI